MKRSKLFGVSTQLLSYEGSIKEKQAFVLCISQGSWNKAMKAALKRSKLLSLV